MQAKLETKDYRPSLVLKEFISKNPRDDVCTFEELCHKSDCLILDIKQRAPINHIILQREQQSDLIAVVFRWVE